ncbi:MAG: 3-methylmercaptopropionyl-CoA dehydrogenase [Glaciecola sp. HTCC2999]|jgi:alkylation response protein AidB-like acyl-CoA dehydrogenase|nr:MAG: 3-methylmercaptopropionyl-CoA dehydrogenase [Glaciecola sp. HTCC2999]
MATYNAPLVDFKFLLNEWLNIDAHYQQINAEGMDSELALEVLAQGAKFAENEIAPLNQHGDEQGCQLTNGGVTTPDGFAAAYQTYIANGWNAMLGSADFDGQDLPYSMAVPVHEMLNSANLSWRLTTMLTESAVLAITKHGSEELKQRYLANIISGEWTGTMNLTEPHAGTDLSLLSTKAEPQADGSYAITGNKIFITAGDHDWSENIIHLVLARLPDAPKGVKGISLFLVPKINVNDDGSLGTPNAVSVGSIEKKMGLKGSPTCVMNYDGARGFLIGEEHAGLACMFTMMNDARFQVGLQGLGIGEASYQGALEYAIDRLQSRAPQGVQAPDKKADPIVFQPDVRRMLLIQRSLTEGCRALSILYAKYMDIEKYANGENQSNAEAVIAYLTPICKAFFTDMATEVSNHGIQIYGGHGYIREWGMEQYVRDTRIAQLYEGTNGIQAADLIGRKLTRSNGEMMKITHAAFNEIVNDMANSEYQSHALGLLTQWQTVSESLLDKSPEHCAAIACDYLNYCAYTLIGILWLSMLDKLPNAENQDYAAGKIKTGEFYIASILPRAQQYLHTIEHGAESVNATDLNDFVFA